MREQEKRTAAFDIFRKRDSQTSLGLGDRRPRLRHHSISVTEGNGSQSDHPSRPHRSYSLSPDTEIHRHSIFSSLPDTIIDVEEDNVQEAHSDAKDQVPKEEKDDT